MKIALIGSKNYKDKDRIGKVVYYLRGHTILTGSSEGADKIIIEACKKFNIKCEVSKLGPEEKIKRIVKECDYMIAFWDKKSKVTKMMIDKVQKEKLPVVLE